MSVNTNKRTLVSVSILEPLNNYVKALAEEFGITHSEAMEQVVNDHMNISTSYKVIVEARQRRRQVRKSN